MTFFVEFLKKRSFLSAGEINAIQYNYNPRFLIDPLRTTTTTTTTTPAHYTPLTGKERFRLICFSSFPSSFRVFSSRQYTLDNYSANSSPRTGGVNLIRQDSYITAVRSAHPNEQEEFGKKSNQIDLIYHDIL